MDNLQSKPQSNENTPTPELDSDKRVFDAWALSILLSAELNGLIIEYMENVPPARETEFIRKANALEKKMRTDFSIDELIDEYKKNISLDNSKIVKAQDAMLERLKAGLEDIVKELSSLEEK